MDQFYTYIYYDITDDQPFYVGKGKNGRVHTRKSKLFQERVQNTISYIEIINTTNEFSAFWLERVCIAAFGRLDRGTGPLLNQTAGGQGMSGHRCSPKTLQRMINDNPMKPGKKNAGSFIDGHTYEMKQTHRENIRLSKLGKKNPNFGDRLVTKHMNIMASCVLCKKVMTIGNIVRWHGDKCRYI